MVRLESPESIVHVPLSAIENNILYNWTPNQPQKKRDQVEEVKPLVKEEVKVEKTNNEPINIENEEQLIMARLNPNIKIENNNEEHKHQKHFNKHHHKKKYFNKQGNKNEEN